MILRAISVNPRQAGFGGVAVLFVILLMVGIGSALTYIVRGSTQDASPEQARALVGILLKQGVSLKNGYHCFSADGKVLPDDTFFSTPDNYALAQYAPKELLKGTVLQSWTVSGNVRVTARGERVAIAMAVNITDSGCALINFLLHGALPDFVHAYYAYGSEAEIPISLKRVGSIVIPIVGENVGQIRSGTFTSSKPFAWREGCMRSTDGSGPNFYFTYL
ncbi:hypothetical protein RY831_14695 [Noviherbaspirillum sp. CPCC 100848]|uniref:Type 4 fimbrial biogenesis protein PilX N-terminal domain-containing protein n=1 Tax=Noviherbaspirillum album TaxID=3080276 RepID=A0ABU6JAF1_9BURK|nr:hypothetical protein [Noviherbaspirillum sp. CPCC 100848]MEC4720408.1 hypothetical protein [Noviherbaspirillum sp. CPCC 100848]